MLVRVEMMLLNIVSHRGAESRFRCRAILQLTANLGGADGHQWHVQSHTLRLRWIVPFTSAPWGLTIHGSVGNRQLRPLRNLRPITPGAELGGLVCAHHHKKLRVCMDGSQGRQGVHGVTGAWVSQFTLVNLNPGQALKRQPGHGQAVHRWGQSSGLVPGLAGGHQVQDIQVQCAQCHFSQGTMSQMRGVERTPKQANALLRCVEVQTQSRACKK